MAERTRPDQWFPELENLTLGWGLPEAGLPIDGERQIRGQPILYPQKAIEGQLRAWRALYSLRQARRQVMEFNLTVGGGFAPVTALHREIFTHRAGKARAAYAFAAVPPQGQPMILDVRRLGESILSAGSFTIPEGFTEVVKLTEFVFSPLKAEELDIFSGHILQLGSTVKGEGVTILLVWEVED